MMPGEVEELCRGLVPGKGIPRGDKGCCAGVGGFSLPIVYLLHVGWVLPRMLVVQVARVVPICN